MERLNKTLDNLLEGDYLEFVLDYCRNMASQGDHGTSADDVYSVMNTKEKLELFNMYVDEVLEEAQDVK